MPSSTRIQLSPSSPFLVRAAVSHLLGEPVELSVLTSWDLHFSDRKTGIPVRTRSPAWDLDPAQDGKRLLATWTFRDLAGGMHYHLVERQEDHAIVLRPDASALAIALGRRLIALFGGRLRHDNDFDDDNEVVPTTHALLSPENWPPFEGDSLTAWEEAMAPLFQSIPPLSTDELAHALDAMSDRPGAKFEPLWEALFQQELEASLPKASPRLKNPGARL
jgi:hypothetical protein